MPDRKRHVALVRIAALLLLWCRAASAEVQTSDSSGFDIMDGHAALGTLALATFSTSLAIGSASGNLGKLTTPSECCPDGGSRIPVWRNTDRILVTTGIVAYSGAAAVALYNLLIADPPSADRPRRRHRAHRWLALGHGAAFVTSAVTGIIMSGSQASNPRRFASTARIHVASNVVLVPVLSMAFSNVVFD
jgi:hypothetical protein